MPNLSNSKFEDENTKAIAPGETIKADSRLKEKSVELVEIPSVSNNSDNLCALEFEISQSIELDPIDGLEIIEHIASGSAGDVYKARHIESGRLFAVKLLSSRLLDDNESARRFERECRQASMLDHPSIVPVYGMKKTNTGRPYLLMDFVEGETLQGLIKRQGELSEKQALPIFIDIAEGLAAAHADGLLHRDIKPGNVIIESHPSPVVKESRNLKARILDFGIAETLVPEGAEREDLELTSTGEILGSPAYMSPEQCLGFKLDERSDIYSFGCLMYEALSGRTPFSAANPVSMITKHLSEQARSLTGAKPGSRIQGLEAVVMRCLEKEPELRYQTFDELRYDLESIGEGKQIKGQLAGPPVQSGLNSKDSLTNFIELFLLSLYPLSCLVFSPVFAQLLPMVLLPVSVPVVIKRWRKYGWSGSDVNKWMLISGLVWIAWGLVSIIVSLGSHNLFYDAMPTWAHTISAYAIVPHVFLFFLLAAAKIGCLTASNQNRSANSKILTQFALYSVLACSIPVLSEQSRVPEWCNLEAMLTNSNATTFVRPNQVAARSAVAMTLFPDEPIYAVRHATDLARADRLEESKAMVDLLSSGAFDSFFAKDAFGDYQLGRLNILRSYLAYRSGEYDEAIKFFRAGKINDTPGPDHIMSSYDGKNLLFEILLDSGRYRDLLMECDKSIAEKGEDDPSIWHYRSRADIALKDYTSALGDLEKCLELRMRYADVSMNMNHIILQKALLLEVTGDLSGAGKIYRDLSSEQRSTFLKLCEQKEQPLGRLLFSLEDLFSPQSTAWLEERIDHEYLILAIASQKLGDHSMSFKNLSRSRVNNHKIPETLKFLIDNPDFDIRL